MYSTVKTSMLEGIHAAPVCVEVNLCAGLPTFDMVGYLSPEVREAKERVRTALHNCGVALPAKRITVNLSPASIRKSGTGFDLPIAAAMFLAIEQVDAAPDLLFVGELNLKGELLPVSGVLPTVADAAERGVRRFVLPVQNVQEARLVESVEVFGFENLKEVLDFLRDGVYRECAPSPGRGKAERPAHTIDFAEVNGQPYLRRVAEIAASGMHNVLMVGPPGAGKTMVSERMATILPPLSEEECIELSRIYSVCGQLGDGADLMRQRPFRSPHHTVTRIGLTGGGSARLPGEISLAHHGVLFLDELTEFDRSALEILRQPLEERVIRIGRASGSVTYPADFLLLAAMNPCGCGYYPDMQRCRCTPSMLRRYFSRVSRPLIDRLDLCVEAPPVNYRELTGRHENECSAQIRARVQECHEIQRRRYAGLGFSCNSRIPAGRLGEFCALGEKEQQYMEQQFRRRNLTARSYHKVLRVARTVADVSHSARIGLPHLQEAVCYRSIDDRFWGGETTCTDFG